MQSPEQNVTIPLPTITGLLVALTGVPLVFLLVPTQGLATPMKVFVSDIAKWSVVAVLLAIVLKYESRPLSSIGIRIPDPEEIPVGITGIFATMIIVGVTSTAIQNAFDVTPDTTAITMIASLSVTQRLLLSITAGITEEILYRGYPIERLLEYTGSKLLAGAIPILIFVGVHLPSWGVVNGISQLLTACILTAIYFRYRSLTACIIIHIGYDVLAVVVGPMMAGA